MKRLLSAILAFALSCSQAFPQAQTLPTLPPAGTPYTGAELLYCVQGGISSKCLVSALGGGIGTIANLTVTGSFLATGLVTNADLVNTGTTVNGVVCTLGSSCTATAAAGTLTGATLAANVHASSLTSLGTIAGLIVTGSLTATGLVTNADLVNASTTVNGTACTLGSTCAAGPTTGDTSASTNPTAGKVGETLVAPVGGPFDPSPSGTIYNGASKSLTAGHWMCTASASTNPAGSTTTQALLVAVSANNNDMPAWPASATAGVAQAGSGETVSTWPVRVDLTATTTYYANIQVFFSVSTITVSADLECLRIW
jgi:hypothetical protein